MSWNLALIDGPIPSFAFLGLDPEGQPIFGDPLPVYNINIAAACYTEALAPFVVQPQYPKRVFAGDDPANRTLTVCLTFADEAEARENLAEWWSE